MSPLAIPSEAELWEVTAAIQVCQSQGIDRVVIDQQMRPEALELLRLSGLELTGPMGGEPWLELAKAYREIGRVNKTYQQVLTEVSKLPPKSVWGPRYPGIEVRRRQGIVVSPHSIQDGFRLGWQVWRILIKHLRTYGVPVRLLGQYGQRADYASFTEGDILSDDSVEDKLRVLANSDLVVGVPNEWTWAAAGFGTKVIVLHPEDIPYDRWFGFDVKPKCLGRLLYAPQQVQPAVILAGMRTLIAAM